MTYKTELLCGTSNTPRNAPKATIDFETRSAVDIMDEGAWKYSAHPTTEVMCLAVQLPHWEKPVLWHPAYPHLGIEESNRWVLDHLFLYIARGGLVEAHNVFFERAIWTNVCAARLGWPSVPEDQWRCSAAKASMYSIPRSLGGACAALGLPVQKDGEGRKVMLKCCKPRKPRKAELALLEAWETDQQPTINADGSRIKEPMSRPRLREELVKAGYQFEHGIWYHESVEEFQVLWNYCLMDVASEHCLSESLPDLPPEELAVWQMDQRMNLKGVLADVDLAKACLRLYDRVAAQMCRELEAITGGLVERPSQRVRVKEWLASQGVHLADTQGTTLDAWIAKEELKAKKPGVHRVLVICREVNRTSTAKYKSCLAMAAADGRMRDLMMYHGASTGRWSGKGLQPHNFPRGSVKDVEALCEVLLTEDVEYIRGMYGEVIKALSDALRGLIVASPGKDLIVADYAAIEARVVLWLARQMDALKVFYEGQCIYCDMATGIYGYKVIKGKHVDERQMGKQAILGLGFGMGFVTFLLTCRKYGITFTPAQARKIVGGRWAELEAYMRGYFFPETKENANKNARATGAKRRRRLTDNGLDFDAVLHELILMKHVVDVYREKYPSVAQMWSDVEAAAIAAVRSPGRAVYSEIGRVTYVVEGRFLKCVLPSGRALHYCDPRIVERKTDWGKAQPTLLFMGVHPLTKQWTVLDTYGGKLVENITQATARDLMAEAMLRAEDSMVYDVLLSVHDEIITEVDEGAGSVEEFEELISVPPSWAKGCPVAAEGWRGKRYRK
jgi:DNA polymerase